MYVGRDTTRYANRKIYLQHFEMEICSTAEMFTSKSTRIVNIEGTSTVPWSTVQSAHTLHQQRLLPPSEKVEMLQVSIGLQVTHIAILMVHCGRLSGPLTKQIPQAISPPVLGTLTTTLSTCKIGV